MSEETASIGATVLSKISIKSIGRSGAEWVTNKDGVTPLGRIAGYARGSIMKEDAQGNAIEALVGEFTAINLESGEVFQSGVCYLPAGMHEQILAALRKPAGENAAPTAVQFAVEIACRKASNKAGYEYVGTMLDKPAESDPMEQLRHKYFSGAAPALTAPKHSGKK